MEKQTGQTKEVGFQFGIRKTFPLSANAVWDFLFSESGLKIWLGELLSVFEINKPFQTKAGIDGLVRVLRPYSHMRLNWKKKNWPHMSTVQVRVIESGEKATISFHQEKLQSSAQRNEMKEYWNKVMDKITDEINKTAGNNL